MKTIIGTATAGLSSSKKKSNGKGFNIVAVVGAVGALAVPTFAAAEYNAVMPGLEAAASSANSSSVAYLERGGDIEDNIEAVNATSEDLEVKLVAGDNNSDPADLCIETAWVGSDLVAEAGEGC